MSRPKLDIFKQGSNGQAVLLVHGLTGVPAEMGVVARALHRQGFTVHAPLLAGHGAGARNLARTRWNDWLSGLEQSAERLASEYGQVSIVGVCVGGALALALARRHPHKVRALALLSTTLDYDGWNVPAITRMSRVGLAVLVAAGLGGVLSFRERFPYGIKCDRIRSKILRESTDGLLTGAIDAFPYASLHEAHGLFRHVRSILPEITCPTLVLHARNDDVSSLRNAEIVKDAVRGPCTMRVLEDSYHMIHLDRERQRVAALTGEFLLAS